MYLVLLLLSLAVLSGAAVGIFVWRQIVAEQKRAALAECKDRPRM